MVTFAGYEWFQHIIQEVCSSHAKQQRTGNFNINTHNAAHLMFFNIVYTFRAGFVSIFTIKKFLISVRMSAVVLLVREIFAPIALFSKKINFFRFISCLSIELRLLNFHFYKNKKYLLNIHMYYVNI